MAAPMRELNYGAIEIYTEDSDTLGIGSYGKVCKAKCGQLPCAAKLLHDTMFGTNDPGIRKFVNRFEQECQFLRAIKHPNIVQFLGTFQSRRLVLLMELMDDSLTRFLERYTGSLPYHTQLNICQDVALALAYLHSNGIIHRDLSSNNVLLIGEGSRAKVTDFGMSILEDMNPHMTSLTMCPGTLVYMPPEALVESPQYSDKLDCFSHGVLTIQIITKQFPNPGKAKIFASDARSPTGKSEIPVAETERRKKDIDLVAPDHPLLPLALHCLQDRDTERPSADELCERLATLKCEPRYTHSVEQSREQNMSLQTLQLQLERARSQIQDCAEQLRSQQQQIQEKDRELERAAAYHEAELSECHFWFKQQIQDCVEHNMSLQKEIQEKDREMKRVRANHEAKLSKYQQQLHEQDSQLKRARAERPEQLRNSKPGVPHASDCSTIKTREYYDIVLIGKRGQGKSTLGNKLLNLDHTSGCDIRLFESTSSFPSFEITKKHADDPEYKEYNSVTSRCKLLANEITNIRVLYVPGFYDSGRLQEETGKNSVKQGNLQIVRQIVKLQVEFQLKVRRVVYFLPCRGPLERADGIFREELRVLHHFFGKDIFECMVVATTLHKKHQLVRLDEDDFKQCTEVMKFAIKSVILEKIAVPPIVYIGLKDSPEECLTTIKGATVTKDSILLVKFQENICSRCSVKVLHNKGENICVIDSEGTVITYEESRCHPHFVHNTTIGRMFSNSDMMDRVFPMFGFTNSGKVCIECKKHPGTTGCTPVHKSVVYKEDKITVEHVNKQ